mgnify:CR=1 FL=1
MKYKIYSVFDAPANGYLQPFFMQTDGMAVRAIQDLLYDENHTFYRNANDYRLYCLGDFSDVDGVISGQQSPIAIATMAELKHLLLKQQDNEPPKLTEVENSHG